MFPIRTSNRKAISVVMTTMIILVASVVLGTGVVIYGTSLFQTGGQQQSIVSQGLKLWVNSTTQGTVNYAWGAAAIRNNGDVLASVNTIQIRGASVPFNNWFVDANQTRVNSGTNFQAQFNLTKTETNGYLVGNALNPATGSSWNGGFLLPTGYTPCNVFARNTVPSTPSLSILIDEDGAGSSLPLCLTQASGPTALNPGQKMIVYFQIPNGVIGPIDSGSAVTVNLYAGNVGGPTTVQVGNP
jgi:hypothetical protein